MNPSLFACPAGKAVFCLLGLALALTPASAALAKDAEGSDLRHEVLRIVQGQSFSGELPASSDVLGYSVEQWPAHGSLVADWPFFEYRPQPGSFGSDSFRILTKTQAAIEIVEYRIDVFPAIQPLAGRWSDGPGVPPFHGYYQAAHRRMVLCDGMAPSIEEPGLVMVCLSHAVNGDFPSASWAVALPQANGVADALFLFDPATARLHRLQRSGSQFTVTQVTEVAGALDRFPVAGDWQGNGQASLAFIARDGEVGSLDAAGALETWPAPYSAPAADRLPWPVRWPREGQADALATLDNWGYLSWVDATGFGGWEVPWYDFAADSRRPYFPEGTVATQRRLHLLDDDLGIQVLKFDLAPLNNEDTTPGTVPIKFPNDPPP